MRPLLWGLAANVVILSGATGQPLPPQVSAVQKYILEDDYPEVFGDKHYKTKIQNVAVADLDGDGQAEVIVHYMPHYNQSPPIVIYRVNQDLSVKRVAEGLAPGPLQPLTGEFLDSHTLGEAADLKIGDQQGNSNTRRKLVEAALGKSSSVVEYVNFFHMDARAGTGTYIDMTGLVVPPKSDTCADVQFSTVRQISAGAVPAFGSGNILAAWAGTKVYLYRIKLFLTSGLLDKEMWTVDVAADFSGFAPGASGPMKYLTASGAERPFVVQCSDHHCALTP